MAEGEVRVSWWGLTKADRGSLSVVPNDVHQRVLYVSAAQGENLAVAVVAVAKDFPQPSWRLVAGQSFKLGQPVSRQVAHRLEPYLH